MSLKGKVVLITGGAQGIGKQIALEFSQAGAKVVLFDLFPEILERTKQELLKNGFCESYVTDVTNAANVEENINKVIDKIGKIDILVNNAGITKDSLLLRLSENDWDKVLAVNLKGAYLCSKAAAKHMIRQKQGKIVNISSIIGIVGNAGQANYSASKAGLIGLTKSLAKELGSRNICVNAVAPGYIQTKMTDVLPDKVKEEMLKRIPLRRFGTSKDVAKAVVFLASPEADYITGQVLVVDGGMI